VISSLLAVASIGAQEAVELIPFEIKDQFDRAYRDADLREKVTVVLGSDKKGSRYNDRWVRAIEALIDSNDHRKVVVIEIADLRGVPFFLRGFVKKKFPKEEENRVLLDWKGRFAKSYGFVADTCNILLFDQRGELVHQMSVTDEEPGKLAEMKEKLEELASLNRPLTLSL